MDTDPSKKKAQDREFVTYNSVLAETVSNMETMYKKASGK
jgi:hypothetical protein